MKIAHISDLHIRNFKYREEYKIAFDDLYRKLNEIKPDIVINTGDTVHSKLSVSPELFDDLVNHFLEVTNIAPYWIILGNHDLNLKNLNRIDSISPAVKALQGRTKHELRLLDAGDISLSGFDDIVFWNFCIKGHKEFSVDENKINIGLYHGPLSQCVSDSGQKLEGEQISKFDAMDYVLLGDIHKRQSFRNETIAYPGSLIQQNYGEELNKGFLVWDIQSKNQFSKQFYKITTPYRFYTIHLDENFDLSSIKIPEYSRIRAMVSCELTPAKRFELEKLISKKFKPVEIITPDSSNSKILLDEIEIDQLIGSRDSLMHEHLRDNNIVSEDLRNQTIELFKQYEKNIPDDEVHTRGTTWSLNKISWDNMMNYGEGNFINLEKLSGLVGIFAPNASGKSSIFDIFLETLFDKVPKDVPKNIDLVNDNKDYGLMVAEIENANKKYSIQRKIEKIQYGQRKFSETKQWGKTSLDFSLNDESLNGDTRADTEKAIRKLIGTFEDFSLTSIITQNPIFGLPGGADIINCKETDRRKILFRFLDLDIYEKINLAVKDDLKELNGKLKGIDYDEIAKSIKELELLRTELENKIVEERKTLSEKEKLHSEYAKELERLDFKNVMIIANQKQKLKDKIDEIEKKIKANSVAKETTEFMNLDAKRINLIEQKPEIPSIPLNELVEKIAIARKSKQDALVEISKAESKINQGIKSLKTLEDIPCEGKFPSCRFIADAVSFNEIRKTLEDAILSFREKNDSITSEIISLEKYEVVHRDIAKWEKQIAEIDVEKSKIESLISSKKNADESLKSELSSALEQMSDITEKLKTFSTEDLKSAEDAEQKLSLEIKFFSKSIDKMLKSCGAIDSKIESLIESSKNIHVIKEKCEKYQILEEMTGKNGLPYRILTMVLPVINFEISKILSNVSKFNVFFETSDDDQNISLHIKYGEYKSRPLGLGSGAEKFIASLAIRAAILSVSSLPKTNMLIIDEGFGKLDPEHLESVQKMFEYLKTAFKTVFIISHVDFMRDIVDHSIDINSSDGYAHVEVE